MKAIVPRVLILLLSLSALDIHGEIVAKPASDSAKIVQDNSGSPSLPVDERKIDVSRCVGQAQYWKTGPDIRLNVALEGPLALTLYKEMQKSGAPARPGGLVPGRLHRIGMDGGDTSCWFETKDKDSYKARCDMFLFNMDPKYNFPPLRYSGQFNYKFGAITSVFESDHSVRIGVRGETAQELKKGLTGGVSNRLFCEDDGSYCELLIKFPENPSNSPRFLPLGNPKKLDEDCEPAVA